MSTFLYVVNCLMWVAVIVLNVYTARECREAARTWREVEAKWAKFDRDIRGTGGRVMQNRPSRRADEAGDPR